jgi:hypothetical protein
MQPADIGRALIYPVAHSTTFIALVSFHLFLQLIGWIIGLGPYHIVSAFILIAFIVPALCLYLIFVLDARARGADPDPPVEHLHWYGSVWSLLQVLYYAFLVYTIYRLGSWYGTGMLLMVFVLFAAVLPASLAILAVTHSPVESLNPLAMDCADLFPHGRSPGLVVEHVAAAGMDGGADQLVPGIRVLHAYRGYRAPTSPAR